MSQLFAMAKKHLLAAQCRQKAYADTKRRDVTFVEGDWVLLSTENLRLQGSRKLLPRFVGPFLITKVVGKHAYRLHSPSDACVSALSPTGLGIAPNHPQRS